MTPSQAGFPPLLVIGALVLLVPIFWIIATKNRYAKLRNMLRESWANVDVALKRRYDLIPNLVETAKAYAAHEQSLFVKVVEARNKAMESVGGIAEQAKDEEQMVLAVNRLIARIEAYPELRSSENFISLQKELANTEDRIAAARRFYNSNVRDFNTMLESFPSSLLAGGQKPESFFEIDDLAVRENVPTNF